VVRRLAEPTNLQVRKVRRPTVLRGRAEYSCAGHSTTTA
jgi:hypothetical protein